MLDPPDPADPVRVSKSYKNVVFYDESDSEDFSENSSEKKNLINQKHQKIPHKIVQNKIPELKIENFLTNFLSQKIPNL